MASAFRLSWLPDAEFDGSLLVGPPQALNTMQRQRTAERREGKEYRSRKIPYYGKKKEKVREANKQNDKRDN